ncbi:hypothetical protein B0H39_002177 [Clostridium beijerinckii]|uniref:hypothetical protein n=1 Tax=Clostridium beijerinckii TaxID=1520 RepID=UPI001494D98B|nr:hypothetical protein [Clostridium beijerinckii]NOW84296.1 hypothetical protein [Clostridium beijerinckii]
MNEYTLKKEIISSYSVLPFMEGLETNVVTVITAAGIITGIPIPSEGETDNTIKLIETINSSITDRYRKDLGISDEERLSSNDGFFTLKDVKLIVGTTTNSLQILNIFYDQVIAITIGAPSN